MKTAPSVDTELIIALERAAMNRDNTPGFRLYCALFLLLAFSSLRFADTTQVECVFNSGTALCGSGVNSKDKSGDLMSWATPITGLLGSAAWAKPILDFWERLNFNKVEQGALKSLFPHVDNDWEVNYKRGASFGLVQNKLIKIARELGYSDKINLHPFRGWAPTCASQLNFPREDRGKLGHWAPGSIMPERYDKAICATELKLRDTIFSKLRSGWRPQHAFQVGSQDTPAMVEAELDVDSDTSETSTASAVKNERINDITNLNDN